MHEEDEQPTYEQLTNNLIPLHVEQTCSMWRIPYPAVVNRGQRQDVPGLHLIGDIAWMIQHAAAVMARSRQGIRRASRRDERRVRRYIEMWENRQEEEE